MSTSSDTIELFFVQRRHTFPGNIWRMVDTYPGGKQSDLTLEDARSIISCYKGEATVGRGIWASIQNVEYRIVCVMMPCEVVE